MSLGLKNSQGWYVYIYMCVYMCVCMCINGNMGMIQEDSHGSEEQLGVVRLQVYVCYMDYKDEAYMHMRAY